jgi:hypothetical protein
MLQILWVAYGEQTVPLSGCLNGIAYSKIAVNYWKATDSRNWNKGRKRQVLEIVCAYHHETVQMIAE